MNKNKSSAKIYTLIVSEIAEGKLFRSIVFFFMLINGADQFISSGDLICFCR